MTSGHFIYIPLTLFLGLVIGFILGGRAARDSLALETRRKAEREKRRADREALRSGDGGPTAA